MRKSSRKQPSSEFRERSRDESKEKAKKTPKTKAKKPQEIEPNNMITEEKEISNQYENFQVIYDMEKIKQGDLKWKNYQVFGKVQHQKKNGTWEVTFMNLLNLDIDREKFDTIKLIDPKGNVLNLKDQNEIILTSIMCNMFRNRCKEEEAQWKEAVEKAEKWLLRRKINSEYFRGITERIAGKSE